LPINPYLLNIGGVDFDFLSSTTALYLAEVDTENQIVRILLGREYDKKTPSIIADEMHSLHRQIPHLKWFVDGANRGAVNECKSKFGERIDGEKFGRRKSRRELCNPVSFGKYLMEML
jgi:hypothetical protein